MFLMKIVYAMVSVPSMVSVTEESLVGFVSMQTWIHDPRISVFRLLCPGSLLPGEAIRFMDRLNDDSMGL